MPAPSYLQDEDEDEQRLPFLSPDDDSEDAENDENVGFAGPDPEIPNSRTPALPDAPPVKGGPQVTVTPEMQRILGQTPAQLPPDQAPVNQTVTQAQEKLRQAKTNVPALPQPKWWQRLGAAGLGFAGGYTNAAGRVRHPIDMSAAEEGILAPGYERAKAQYGTNVAQAQAGLEAAQAEQQQWWKNRQLNNQEALQEAEAERAKSQAAYYEGRDPASIERAKVATTQKTMANMLKGRDQFGYQKDSEPVPPGTETVQDLENPGHVYVVSPSRVPLPADLAKFAPGYKVGDLVPWAQFKSAQTAAQQDLIKNQDRPPAQRASTEAELAAVATDPTKTPAERAAADAALKRLDQSKIAARPNIAVTVPGLGGDQSQHSNLTGQDFLASLPIGTANQVRAIAEGRTALPPVNARGSSALLRDAVFRYDPDFSEQRGQIRKAFTTGQDGRNIGSLNTATVHLDQLDAAAQAMQNGSFRPGNDLWNSLRATFGSSAPTNFDTLKSAVAGEMANALKGTATDVEIASMSRNLQSANSPQQLSDAIQENLRILGGKLNTYYERYQQQIPGDRVWNPVMPSSRAVFTKHAIDPTAGPQVNISGSGGGRGGAGGQAGGRTGMVTVQIPGHPPGQIPAAAQAQFLHDNPGAKVIQ